MEVRQEHLLHHGLEGERRQEPIEGPVRTVLVEAIQGLSELGGEPLRRGDVFVLGGTLGGERAAGGLGGRQPLRDQRLRAQNPPSDRVGWRSP